MYLLRCSGPLFLVLATALLPLPARAAPPADTGPEFLVIPNGVTDPEGKVGYLTNPEGLGGIDAVNLADGKVLWSTKDATRPIALLGRKLVAQHAGIRTLTIVVLDTADRGKTLLEAKPLPFPDWVSVYNTWGRRFSSEAWLDGNDVIVKWEAHGFYQGGLTLPPELYKSYIKDASGYDRVSLDSGKVDVLEGRPPVRPTLKLPKELADVARGGVVIGSKVAVTAVEPAGQEQKLVLKSWELATARANEPVVLFQGKELQVESVEGGRQVLVRQPVPGDDDWRLFSLDTGKQVARFPHEPGTGWLDVAGPRAFYAVHGTQGKYPPEFTDTKTLKAVDLKTGKVIWERLVEAVRFIPPPQ
jgi:hypothetical protein